MSDFTVKNRYFVRSRISEAKLRQIVKYFAADLTASQIALLSGVSRPTANKILGAIRKKIAGICETENALGPGEVELDESYFGPRRVRGKRGRGAARKTVVFGLKKRGGKVYTQIIKNCSKGEILPLIRRNISREAVVFTDGFKTYDGLVDMGYRKHYRILHGKNEFAKSEGGVSNHINGIENFWGLAKVRLAKFRGMSKDTFYLHLKECEFRFNHRGQNIYRLLLDALRKDPLKLS